MIRLASVALLLTVATCSGGGDAPSEAPSIREVKTRHERELLDLPGVVSVGIGLDDDGAPAIIVGLEAPDPETEDRIPANLEGYPVVIEVIGPITTQ